MTDSGVAVTDLAVGSSAPARGHIRQGESLTDYRQIASRPIN